MKILFAVMVSEKIFIGLDGMLVDGAIGRRTQNRFIDFWKPIISTFIPNISKRKLKLIYSLRSALLHGDYVDFMTLYPRVYKALYPNDNRSVGIRDFAFNFAAFVLKAILAIEQNPKLLTPKKHSCFSFSLQKLETTADQ